MGSDLSKPWEQAPTLQDSEETKSTSENFQGDVGTISHDVVKPIMFGKAGRASEKEYPAQTLGQFFKLAAENHPTQVALAVERPCPAKNVILQKNQWKTWSFKEYYDETVCLSKACLKLGFDRYDSISVFGFNAPEWNMSEVGAILAGGKIAGIYPSDPVDQIVYKVKHSGARLFMVDHQKKIDLIQLHLNELPKLHTIVLWGEEKPAASEFKRDDGSVVQIMHWDDIIALGKEEPSETYDKRTAEIKPHEACALIYTSGTTGNPKGVMLSHDNITWTAHVVCDHLPIGVGQERILSYLPQSHVAGGMVDIIAPVIVAAMYKNSWFSVYFARSYDLKMGTIRDRLQVVKPTIFLGVPRVWEKISESLRAVGASITGIKKQISTWGKGKGLAAARNSEMGGSGKKPSNYGLADKLVMKKVKAALGLDQCKFGFTGAAPISMDTLQYFGQLGIQINECYGMSESCGATTWSTDAAHVWGSCGWALPGMDVKCFIVDPADVNKKTECPKADDLFSPTEEQQGEICFRGRHILMGYYANPDLGEEHVAEMKKKTAESIDSEGWLHSGDKGVIDKRGLVRITGRYKELIIGSGGENIAPVPVEDAIKAAAPAISNIMMVGDKRKFNVALLTLKAVGANLDVAGTDELDAVSLAAVPESESKKVSEAMKDEKWIAYLTKVITTVNKDLMPPARIQRFCICPRDFSVETMEFTPTFKLKRAYTEKLYGAAVENMYQDNAPNTQAYFEFPSE